MSVKVNVSIEGRELTLSNLDKVLFPRTGMTKGDVVEYYTRIAPALLPHIRNRTISLKRYPEGWPGSHFYEKQCPSHHPPWVETKKESSGRRRPDYCVVGDLPTLIWIINLASLELHTFLYRIENDQIPTMVMFDLDPGPPAGMGETVRVALMLRDLFDSMGLASFPKMSGGKGIHLALPVNGGTTDFEGTKRFARAVAGLMERENPRLIVSSMSKQLRNGKVFIDWSQNDHHKTTVSVYSLRVHEIPTVSAPVTWGELGRALETDDFDLLTISPAQAVDRVKLHGDLYADVASLEQRLPEWVG